MMHTDNSNVSIILPGTSPAHYTFSYLFHHTLLHSYEKQCKLNRFIQKLNASHPGWRWGYDLDHGNKITFGPHALDAQFLGSESYLSWSWLWGFANEQIPSQISTESRALHELLGTQHASMLFLQVQLATDAECNADSIALICVYLLSKSCYYRMPNGDAGLGIVTIKSELIDNERGFDGDAFISCIESIQSLYAECKHRLAIEEYLRHGTITAATEGNLIRLKFSDDDYVGVHFDDIGMITSIDRVNPEA